MKDVVGKINVTWAKPSTIFYQKDILAGKELSTIPNQSGFITIVKLNPNKSNDPK
jgi:hypothetical protein